ncbi:hypothetical protein CA54_46150 [Symmachiella macrocystis]|uniref:Uncharacterized protein n=1 Tax=Symmachiella macrocystis TaxID=2527985 RepID=A0A5C6BG10_9PLAN|nr:hypothetical protein [Symmachiella macrocystis]TWU09374.1 hypothetical protein CA54_46150 [Symmachiella macrocystis]
MGAFIGQLIDGRERWLTWKSAVAGTFWCGLNLIALTVFARWLAGAFSAGPPTAVVCATAVLLTVVGLGSNALFHQLDFRGEHWLWGALPAFLTLFPLMVLLIVIPDSAASAWWFSATVVCVSVVTVFALETTFRHRQQNTREVAVPKILDTKTEPIVADNDIDTQLEARLAGTISTAGPIETENEEMPWHAPEVSQWMTRSDADDGSVTVEGVTIAKFAAGQNRANVHLTFCPPLPVSPQIECETVDGDEVRIKVAAVFPHGARIELTRPAHDNQDAPIAIGYFAHTEQNQSIEAAA